MLSGPAARCSGVVLSALDSPRVTSLSADGCVRCANKQAYLSTAALKVHHFCFLSIFRKPLMVKHCVFDLQLWGWSLNL